MAQHDMVLDNANGLAFRSDANDAIAALVTCSSGAAAPTTTYPDQWWADTGSTPKMLRRRNNGNSAWLAIMNLDTGLAADIQGQGYTSGTTGGTSTAYTLTPVPALAAYTAGQSFFVTFHAACGAAPTFAISGIATPPTLVKQLADGTYAALAANDVPINHRSRVTLISTTQALVELLPPGKVFVPNQVVKKTRAIALGAQTESVGTYTTALTAAITPSSNLNKVRITITGQIYVPAVGGVNAVGQWHLLRGATDLTGNVGVFAEYAPGGVGVGAYISFVEEDAPATTSATTYTVQFRTTNGSVTVQISNLRIFLEEIQA